jgi:hypothetical protein
LDSGGAPAQVEELTVDTAIQADDLARYAERFNNNRPNIRIQRVCNPSAIIAEKVLAERYHPKRDAIWGWRRLPATRPHDRLRNCPVRSLDPGFGVRVGTKMGANLAGVPTRLGGSFQISPTCLTRWNAAQSAVIRAGISGAAATMPDGRPGAHVWHRLDAEKQSMGSGRSGRRER